jgi:hypothetical protein
MYLKKDVIAHLNSRLNFGCIKNKQEINLIKIALKRLSK